METYPSSPPTWLPGRESSVNILAMTLAMVLLFAAVILARVSRALARTVALWSRHLENMMPKRKSSEMAGSELGLLPFSDDRRWLVLSESSSSLSAVIF